MKNKTIRTIFTLMISAAAMTGFSIALAQTPATTATATAATTTSSTVAPPNAREGFSISPANGQATAHNFSFQVKAGETAGAKAYIKNFSSNPVHFFLYGADPTLSNTGSLAYKTRDQSSEGSGSWIKFASPEVDLAPNEEKLLAFTVTVPAETTPGEYRAGVTMEKTKAASNAPGITIATRVVNQAKITVLEPSGALPPATTATAAPAVAPPSPAGTNPIGWQSYYFWISFGLFLASLTLLVWTIFYDRKNKRHPVKPHHAGTHTHGHHESKSHKGHSANKHGKK